MKYLFTMWEGGGNIPPTLAVVRRLRRAGHSVRFLGEPCHAAEVRDAGAEFVSWTTAPHRKDKGPESDFIRDWEAGDPPALIGMLRDRLMFGPAKHYAADTAAEIARSRPDCLVTSDMLLAPAIAAEAAKIPCVLLSANVYLYPRPGVPPFGPGFLPAAHEKERERNQQIEAGTLALLGDDGGAFNEARKTLGLPPLTHPFDQIRSVAGVLMLTSPHFDFLPSEADARFVYAGPELEDPIWAERWTSPWRPDDERPLILVGMSTTFQNQAALLGRLCHVLRDLPVRAVVTAGHGIDPAALEGAENVAVCRTAPHAQILQDASLMITQAGHGSVMRGLAAGVPLLCIPQGRDQNDNAARVEHRKVGLRLTADASDDALRGAITNLLSNEMIRSAAAQLGSLIRQDFERSIALESLERWGSSGQRNLAA